MDIPVGDETRIGIDGKRAPATAGPDALDGVGGVAKHCHPSRMKKQDNQVCVKLSGPLRAVLEDWAAAESRGLSSLIRRLLINAAAQRVVDHSGATTMQEVA
jgi:hypothetical protein